MSIHVCKCTHGVNIEYHLRYPGMTEEEAQSLADKINGGWLREPRNLTDDLKKLERLKAEMERA